MKQEIEIKLAIAPYAVEKLVNCAFFSQLNNELEPKMLINTYYDTAEWSLQAQKIALRIREDGALFIQTLKTQGHSAKGLHKRMEWEWPLLENKLNLELLPPEHWPKEIEYARLIALFSTNFSRRIWCFSHIGVNGDTSEIEMVLDRGLVSSALTADCVDLCELELELISGNSQSLTEVANILIAQCPELTLSDISKAARGFALLRAAGN